MDLKDFLFEELESHLFDLGEPRYKAEQVFRALYQNQVSDITEISKLSQELSMF